jgi:sorbose reductase
MSDQGLFNLEGRTALVTGGGQGLGRAMALGLARHGANIAILDINPETGQDSAHEMERAGVKSLALTGDVTKEDHADRAVRAVVDAWGRLDILVNNAGFALLKAAEETSVEEFKSIYELDVFGMFICSKAAFAAMSRQKQGNIINMASMCALTVLVPQKHASYNSAKAAVVMLTKSLAVEWAPHGIRVNAIAPGYMCTPPVRKIEQDDPDRWAFLMSRIPLRRAGDPAELEGAAVFLASRASAYMTGSILVIDGGHTCM